MKDLLNGDGKAALISQLRTGVRASSIEQYLATLRMQPSTALSAGSPMRHNPLASTPRHKTLSLHGQQGGGLEREGSGLLASEPPSTARTQDE